MRGRLTTAVMVAACQVMVVKGLLHPFQRRGMISSLPLRLLWSSYPMPRGCRAHQARPDEGEGANGRSVEDRITALETEVKTMREFLQEEFKMLREALLQQQQQTRSPGSSEEDLVSRTNRGTSESPRSSRARVETSSQPGKCVAVVAATAAADHRADKRTILAAVKEAASVVFDLAKDLSTEDNFWGVYAYSKVEFYQAPSNGLTREQARRKMMICKDDAEKWTRNSREQLATARDRVRDLYLELGPLAPLTNCEDDPIAAIRDLYGVLNLSVGKVEASETMDSTAMKLLEEERDAFYGILNESENRLKKVLRAMER